MAIIILFYFIIPCLLTLIEIYNSMTTHPQFYRICIFKWYWHYSTLNRTTPAKNKKIQFENSKHWRIVLNILLLAMPLSKYFIRNYILYRIYFKPAFILAIKTLIKAKFAQHSCFFIMVIICSDFWNNNLQFPTWDGRTKNHKNEFVHENSRTGSLFGPKVFFGAILRNFKTNNPSFEMASRVKRIQLYDNHSTFVLPYNFTISPLFRWRA